VKEFSSKRTEFKEGTNLLFTLPNGHRLKNHLSVARLKKIINKKSVDGLVLFPMEVEVKK
jgi:hypothetical protein